MLFDATDVSGLGITPFGTYFGAGTEGTWGLFSGTTQTTRLETSCESCQRIRSVKALGGGVVLGSYVSNGYLYLISDAADAACFSVRFPGGDVPVVLVPGAAPPILVSEPPIVTSPTPLGVVAATLMRAQIPEVNETGDYTVELVNRCNGSITPIVTLTLEMPAMIFTPLDADLGGAPKEWLYGQRGGMVAAQPASGSRLSIPFDKVLVLHEYDPRLGTPPSAQGWAHSGSGSAGDFTLVEGGVLKMLTTVSSIWTATTTVTVPAAVAYAYSVINALQETTYTVEGDGFEMRAQFAVADGDDYCGLRCNYTDQWRATRLSGASDGTIGGLQSAGWTGIAASAEASSLREQAWLNGGVSLAPFSFNLAGPVAGLPLDMVTSFGDENGSGVSALIRSVVASYGGRFIRPVFSSYAPITNPVLRLYTVADANLSTIKTARFRVRYGTAMGNPYGALASSEEITVNYVTPNASLETQIQLSGLVANKPFWFSVERVWDHGADVLDATVHLTLATIRSY